MLDNYKMAKSIGFVGAGFTLTVVLSACALIPNFGGGGMSNKEQATLNLQMGVQYMKMGMLDVAREKLEAALDFNSSDADIHDALAVFYERINKIDEAEDRYKSALSLDPDNLSVKNNYGRFLCEHGHIDKGMDMLNGIVNSPMNNRTWFALSNIAMCFERQNNLDRAEDFFRQALLVEPDYAPALMEMLKITYKKQQYMSARAFLQRYVGVAEHTAETLWYAFQTERALGNAQAAEDYRSQLTSKFPASNEAHQVKAAISK